MVEVILAKNNTYNLRNVSKIIIAVFLIFSLIIHTKVIVKAYPVQGYVTGSTVNVRSGHSTDHSEIDRLNKDHPVTVIDQSNQTGWYKIQYVKDGVTKEGWMSNNYIRLEINAETDPEFEKLLNEQKFPESYKQYLRELHILHPNWEFVAMHTGLDWNRVLKEQLTPVYRNMVPASSIASWKSIESGAYLWDTGKWINFEPGWVAASSDILAYFMDPRNALVNGGEILQFLSLGWTGKETKEGVQNILKGTFMERSDLDYARYFMEAGQLHGVSPYHLASRAIQEVGINGSASVQGPYYNFYNIGATGSEPVKKGLEYAKNKGWDTPEKSIKEGAGFITNNYIKKGQDTLYLQKFNVTGTYSDFWHQYMSNIQAPTNEAKNMLKTLPNFNNGHYIFKIPVYQNMPATAVVKPTSNADPNYYLSNLKVDNYSLTPVFSVHTTTYSLIVPENVTSINISATPVKSTTKVTGTGTHQLSPGINEIKVTSTAQNGKSITYTINVSRGTQEYVPPTPSPTPTPTQPPANNEYTITSDFAIGASISGINPGTSIDKFKERIKVTNASIEVVNADGTKATGNVGTGKKLQIIQGNKVVKEYPIIIYGDTNGDGNINIVDLANVQKHILNVKKLEGVYAEASNTRKNGAGINIVDLANIQKHILNVSLIKQ